MSKITKESFDFIILGAGFAGLSMADELLQRNQSVCLIDKAEPGSGSSGAPLVLINPATGRRAKMVRDVGKSLEVVTGLLNRVQKFAGHTKIFEQNGVLRPALDEELAKDFKRSPTKYDWPDDSWIEWLDQDEFSSKFNYIGSNCGGLVVKPGLTVNTQHYISHLTDYLESIGLNTQFNADLSISQNDDSVYEVEFSDGKKIRTNHIIYATGSAVQDDSAWNFLPFKKTKGQLLDLRFESPLPLHASISSMGYFAIMPSDPHRLVVGSTYEHSYNDLKTDLKGKRALYKKLDRTLPGLSDKPHTSKMWSGERVSTKDHKPAIGEHPLRRRSYLLSGLGSKGMIQGRYLAKQLADYILDEAPINPEFNLSRFQSF